MFSLYRRHEAGCKYQGEGGVRYFNRCKCPVWMDGTDEHGKRQRRSLKTRSWTLAQTRLNALENGKPLPPPDRHDQTPLIETAIASFLEDCHARSLAQSSVRKYTNTLAHLSTFFAGTRLSQVDLDALTNYRVSRAAAAGTTKAEIGTIRSFFRFCEDRDWTTKNPAARLKAPNVEAEPTLPFTAAEVSAMLKACDQIEDTRGAMETVRTRNRARALVLLLLYSGLRISDAIKLERSRLNTKTGDLMIRMMKTREPLYVRLQPHALRALTTLPEESPYFFWNGKSQLRSMIRVAARTIERLLERAGIKDGHPHRFRDTFAVTLLVNGVKLETVQKLLGHTSIKTTEKHYAPWCRDMQTTLNAATATLNFGAPDKATSRASRNAKAGVNANEN
jgi:site-specific recombinase XerD